MSTPKIAVPLLDLKPQYHALKAELDEAMLKVAASQMFILGPAVKELEEQLAAYSGAKHGIGLSSGTTRCFAMMADESRRRRVVTSPNTFFATGARSRARAPGFPRHRSRNYKATISFASSPRAANACRDSTPRERCRVVR